MRQTILWLIFFIDNDDRFRYFIFTFKKLFFAREIVNGAFRRRNSDDRASAIYIDRIYNNHTTIIFHSALSQRYLILLIYLTVLTRTCESLRCVKSTENARSDFVSPNNRRECKPNIEKEDRARYRHGAISTGAFDWPIRREAQSSSWLVNQILRGIYNAARVIQCIENASTNHE